MPVMDNERAIKEYWNEVKHKYPDMTFDDFRKICKSPFEYFKRCIANGEFPRILVKYMGKFKIFKGKVKNLMTDNQLKFERGYRDEIDYEKFKIQLAEHLKNIEEDEDDDEEDNDDSTGASEDS
jgi:hypothetical protein